MDGIERSHRIRGYLMPKEESLPYALSKRWPGPTQLYVFCFIAALLSMSLILGVIQMILSGMEVYNEMKQ